MVAAGQVPISVGPIPSMAMPNMPPPVNVQRPVPGPQNMPVSAGRGQGAAMSPRPGPGGPGPTFPGAPGGAVMQGGPRPAPGAYPVYAAPMPYAAAGRMVPAAYNMVGVPMGAGARMGPVRFWIVPVV